MPTRREPPVPQAQPSPRLVRSVCPTDQHVLSNAPKTAETITKLRKIEPPDPTISSKALNLRPFQPARKNSPAEPSFLHASPRSNHPPRFRTEPNKPEHHPSSHSPRITRPHPEPHRQNPHITRQIWTNLDSPGHQTRQFPAHSARCVRSPRISLGTQP